MQTEGSINPYKDQGKAILRWTDTVLTKAPRGLVPVPPQGASERSYDLNMGLALILTLNLP